jgi:hypothetical protein
MRLALFFKSRKIPFQTRRLVICVVLNLVIGASPF